jgi:6-phosphofructokinase 1
MSNCLVAQSGGPTAVINASLSGIIEAGFLSDEIDTVYGSLNGIQGVLEDRLMNLTERFENHPEDLERLKYSPAMYLGSCRYKLKKEEYVKIFNIFEQYNIKYFFYIGGNDSMDTVLQLSEYAAREKIDVAVMGVPKTIDNDLFGTDHTPGFASAAKFIATTILEVTHDAMIYSPKSVTIVEIMGRNAGWLTASAAVARTSYSSAPDLIYLPEKPFSVEAFIDSIKELLVKQNNIVVAVSEGVKDKDGNFISAIDTKNDAFGHVQLSGTGKVLEEFVKEKVGCKVRSVELNVTQRAAAHIASLTDIKEADLVGKEAVKAALNGTTGYMVTIQRKVQEPYSVTIGTIDIREVANKEKRIPESWINEAGNNVTKELVEYIRPLIQGEPQIEYKNGLPNYLAIDHLAN